MYGPTLAESIATNLAQAKAVKARPDYDKLPECVKNWCEDVIKKYGDSKWKHLPIAAALSGSAGQCKT